MTIPMFTLVGTFKQLTGSIENVMAGAVIDLNCNVKSNILIDLDGYSQLIGPVQVTLDENGQINGGDGVELLANDESLDLTGDLQWTISPVINSPWKFKPWTFTAAAEGETLDIRDALPVVFVPDLSSGTIGTLGWDWVTDKPDWITLLASRPAGELPATSPKHLTTQGGNTLDDGAGNAVISGTLNGVAVPIPLRPRCNTIAVVGDSITALGSETWYQPWLGHTWVNQLQIMSHQRIRYGGGNFSVSATGTDTQLSVQLPQVLAMNPLPGACVLAVGSQNIHGTTYDFDGTSAAVKTMVAALLAVGVAPILWTAPPNNGTWVPSTAEVHRRIYHWNSWVRRYAAQNGFALIDAHTAIAQLNGTANPNTVGAGDGYVHPNGYGHRLIAEQALADGLADIFPPNSMVNTARNTDDLSNILNNGTINQGLFTTDGNSDGVADGLSGGGTGTHTASLVTPAAKDQLLGNWQQSTASAGATSNLTAILTTGWSVGDVIAFSCRYQTSGVEVSGGGWHLVALHLDTPGGYTTPYGHAGLTYLWNGTVQWDCDIEDGELYLEFEIPAGTTALQLWISIGGGTTTPVTLRVGEVTIRNLTTEGLLV